MGACLRTHSGSLRCDIPTYINLQKKAGGGVRCHTVSKVAALTLLSVSGTCDQQDAADKMIDLAKTLNNNADMIELAQIFVQQPRNSVRPISSIILLILFIISGAYF